LFGLDFAARSRQGSGAGGAAALPGSADWLKSYPMHSQKWDCSNQKIPVRGIGPERKIEISLLNSRLFIGTPYAYKAGALE
jgi:hypothetical protein